MQALIYFEKSNPHQGRKYQNGEKDGKESPFSSIC